MFKFAFENYVELYSDNDYYLSKDYGSTWVNYRSFNSVEEIEYKISQNIPFTIISIWNLSDYGFSVGIDDFGIPIITDYPKFQSCMTYEEYKELFGEYVDLSEYDKYLDEETSDEA